MNENRSLIDTTASSQRASRDLSSGDRAPDACVDTCATKEFNYWDLRDSPDSPELAHFIRLYDRTFTDPAEREDPGVWADRLRQDQGPPQPRTHLVVACNNHPADVRSQSLVGGVMFEHYRTSNCGLLTYLAVEPAYRGCGIARALVRHAAHILQAAAEHDGAELRAIFAEAEHPDHTPIRTASMPPRERLRALHRMGVCWVDIPYVQPCLVGGSDRARGLILMTLATDTRMPTTLPGRVIFDFLHEFYRALRIDNPDADSDFQAMAKCLRNDLILKPLPFE